MAGIRVRGYTRVKPTRKAKPPRKVSITVKDRCTCGSGALYMGCPVHPERGLRPDRPRSIADMRSVSLMLRCRKLARIAKGCIQEIKETMEFIPHAELRAEVKQLLEGFK